jgi:hypothetical protein
MGLVSLSSNLHPVSRVTPGCDGIMKIHVVASPPGSPPFERGHMYIWAILQGDKVLMGESTETYSEACARAKLAYDTLEKIQDKKRHAAPEKGTIFSGA